MLAKICVLILSLGLVAGVLLHLRQARLQAVHELAKVQLRMSERDRDLLRVRNQIAAKVTPERIEEAARRFGELEPVRTPGEAHAEQVKQAKPGAGASRASAEHE